MTAGHDNPHMGPSFAAVALAAGVALLSLACTNTEQTEIPLSVGDEAEYGRWVEPYVTLRCGSLDCHGDMRRPFRLYGGGGLRLVPELRGDFTSPEEVRANVLAFAGISPASAAGADASEHLALRKGLAVDAGGLAHVGGDVWASVEDPGYRCVSAWLRGQTDEPEIQTDCTVAAEEVPH